ncbi:hypothetical protein F4679DRAFT_595051 [Xylaria curta]|nr:hypothetical protein F4679DRAFT_595051 [Xylaria curta]
MLNRVKVLIKSGPFFPFGSYICGLPIGQPSRTMTVCDSSTMTVCNSSTTTVCDSSITELPADKSFPGRPDYCKHLKFLRIVVMGPSMSGKSFFVRKLREKYSKKRNNEDATLVDTATIEVEQAILVDTATIEVEQATLVDTATIKVERATLVDTATMKVEGVEVVIDDTGCWDKLSTCVNDCIRIADACIIPFLRSESFDEIKSFSFDQLESFRGKPTLLYGIDAGLRCREEAAKFAESHEWCFGQDDLSTFESLVGKALENKVQKAMTLC